MRAQAAFEWDLEYNVAVTGGNTNSNTGGYWLYAAASAATEAADINTKQKGRRRRVLNHPAMGAIKTNQRAHCAIGKVD